MKGIVFTEFLEMVENRFSEHTVDQLIEQVDLPSKGIYTSVLAECSGDGDSLEGLLARSDQALYFAKQTGRNRSDIWMGDAAR
jgi:PleD family two-component response regulator